MAKKYELIPANFKRPLAILFFIILGAFCLVEGITTSSKMFRYHSIQPRAITTTAYLSDNGFGKNIPHTGGGRRAFNYTLYYYFYSNEGKKIYSTDEVAKQDYSTQNRAGRTLKVTYDWRNPKTNYLDRSVYGKYESYFQMLFYFGGALTSAVAIGIFVTRGRNEVRPLGWPQYLLYSGTAAALVGYLLG